jgi:hypothetical protein
MFHSCQYDAYTILLPEETSLFKSWICYEAVMPLIKRFHCIGTYSDRLLQSYWHELVWCIMESETDSTTTWVGEGW